MEPLTPGTIRRIEMLFPANQRAEASRLLETECGDNLPFAETLKASGIERIRFAALKIGDGSLDQLYLGVQLAQVDWRDALMSAGFAYDSQAHLAWLADA
jgi:hypothetical protein